MLLRRMVALVGIGAMGVLGVLATPGCKKDVGGTAKPPPMADWRELLKKKIAEHKANPKGSLPPKVVQKIGAQTQVSYNVDAGLAALEYPTQTNLPPEYQSYYGDLASSIQMYTLQSLQRDGFSDAVVVVTSPSPNYVQIQITSQNPAVAGYAEEHVGFLFVAAEGLLGSAICMQCTDCATCALCPAQKPPTPPDTKCWDPSPVAGSPWWPFLPLGLPLLNQKTVLFLDYPPVAALEGKDYLSNFTMCRWGRVLGGAGAVNPSAYETIVDTRPIAAAGSGQDGFLPVPQATYNDSSMTTGAYYLTPMLGYLSNPLAQQVGSTLPIAVFGYPARQTWGQIIGYSGVPPVLAVGTTSVVGQGLSTGWISTNHPDVTAYDTCTADPKNPKDLRQSEQIDLVASCWMMSMGASPTQDPNAALAACQPQWNPPAAGSANALNACIQEKLDDNNKASVCCTYQDAWAYCTDNSSNACATVDCKVNPATVAKAPPNPPWWAECNHYRGYCTGAGPK